MFFRTKNFFAYIKNSALNHGFFKQNMCHKA